MSGLSVVLCICITMFAFSLAAEQEECFTSAAQLHSAGKLDSAIKKMSVCCHQDGDITIAAQACFNTAVYLSESQNFVESSKYATLSSFNANM
jgi:hypothetical protein